MSLETMSTSLTPFFSQRLYVNVLQTPTQKGQLENMKLYFPEHKYTQELPHYLPATHYLCHVAKAVYQVYFQKSQGRKENAFADKKMQLLYVDSVKSSKNSKAKCLKFMVLTKLSWRGLVR